MKNVTAKWIDNSTLEVNWEPVPVTDGVTITYIIYYSAVMETRNGMHYVNGMTSSQTSITTQTSSGVIMQLDPAAFYQITVSVNFKENQGPSSVGIGA